MIKNIVFDIGGVLTDYRLKEFLADKGFDGLMIKRILKASILSPYWESFERSELTEEETFRCFASLDPEIEKEIRIAYDNVKGMLVMRDFSIELIRSLKNSGLHVYYLSNYSGKAFRECDDSLEFIGLMDGGLLSFQCGMTKPDPRMYKAFLEQYRLNSEECLFIDDTRENVEVAESLGFKGIVYENYTDTMEKIIEFTKENILD